MHAFKGMDDVRREVSCILETPEANRMLIDGQVNPKAKTVSVGQT